VWTFSLFPFFFRTVASRLTLEFLFLVHWYGTPDVDTFKVYMKAMYELYAGKTPLLVTEFAIVDWSATAVDENQYTRKEVLAFMKIILPWVSTNNFDREWQQLQPIVPPPSDLAPLNLVARIERWNRKIGFLGTRGFALNLRGHLEVRVRSLKMTTHRRP